MLSTQNGISRKKKYEHYYRKKEEQSESVSNVQKTVREKHSMMTSKIKYTEGIKILPIRHANPIVQGNIRHQQFHYGGGKVAFLNWLKDRFEEGIMSKSIEKTAFAILLSFMTQYVMLVSRLHMISLWMFVWRFQCLITLLYVYSYSASEFDYWRESKLLIRLYNNPVICFSV